MSGDSSKRYPPALKGQAVRMVTEVRADQEWGWAAMAWGAELWGVGSVKTIRKWVRRAEIDGGARPGTTSAEAAEVKRLKRLTRENAEPRRANAILTSAAALFGAELDRPSR